MCREESILEEGLCSDGLESEEGLYSEELEAEQFEPITCSSKIAPRELQAMIMENRESARKIAHSLLRRWRVALPTEEIESLVDLTLCEAANRYSPDQGASFMTFFFYYVRGNLARNIGKLARISQFFVSPGNALETLSFLGSSGIHSGESGASGEQWGSCTQENGAPEQLLLSRERISLCNRALNKLDAVDREVLLRLYDGEESLVDIARTLGYSRCHISRIKKRALRQFQASFAEVSDTLPKTIGRTPTTERNSIKRRGRHRREISPTLLQRKQLVNNRQYA